MAADKIALKAELYDLFVNLGFGAAYICDDTVILYDILIVAIGKPKFIDASYVKDGAVVIDVGRCV